jgi:hypothetical protein
MIDPGGGEIVRWLIVSIVVSLALVGLRNWAPKAGARRIAERGSLVGPALKPSFEDQAMRRNAVDLQNIANKQLHDDMLADAIKLKLRARAGTVEERIETIDRALQKTEDALTARPESYEGTKLLAELHLDRALVMEGMESVAPLEQAAQLFEKASSYRLGVIDNYLGRGWAYLQMTRVDPEYSAVHAHKAAMAFAGGFQRAQQNVWVLRGWGLAIDRFARAPHTDPTLLSELEADYRHALGQHRGGQHELFAWYGQVRSASEPMRIDVPPLRDVY